MLRILPDSVLSSFSLTDARADDVYSGVDYELDYYRADCELDYYRADYELDYYRADYELDYYRADYELDHSRADRISSGAYNVYSRADSVSFKADSVLSSAHDLLVVSHAGLHYVYSERGSAVHCPWLGPVCIAGHCTTTQLC